CGSRHPPAADTRGARRRTAVPQPADAAGRPRSVLARAYPWRTHPMTALNLKLANIRAGRYTPKDFIIADAKDGDMGFGRTAPGPDLTSNRLKTRAQYLQAMEEMCDSGAIDILLCSASTCEILTRRGVFERSGVTPAIRL